MGRSRGQLRGACCRGPAEIRSQIGGTGAGRRRSLNGKLDELVNVLGAATATAAALQSELGFQLTRRDNARPPGFADIRFGDTVTDTDVHGSVSIDYEKRSHYALRPDPCQAQFLRALLRRGNVDAGWTGGQRVASKRLTISRMAAKPDCQKVSEVISTPTVLRMSCGA